MITAEVSVVQIGAGISESEVVKKFIEGLRKSKLKIIPGSMCTAIEARNTGQLFEAIDKAHNGLFENGVERIITTIKIDDRRDRDSTIHHKLEAIAH
jgi:uncharacterized protein (TIGR00106 family)